MKIGLVLEGGEMRRLYTAGVKEDTTKILEKLKQYIDYK